MKVQICYFGPARDWAGCGGVGYELEDGATLGVAIERVMNDHPELASRRKILRFAVNEEFASESKSLADGDEIAVIPPVSGGADDDFIEIVEEPIDRSAVWKHVQRGGAVGGVLVFEGLTRPETHEEHGPLIGLEYEAYGGMAVKQLGELAKRARERWPIERLGIIHRIGSVGCGETSVMIAVGCAHRKDAFAACRWLIDTLKRDVPIWKREIWESGASSWVDPTKSADS